MQGFVFINADIKLTVGQFADSSCIINISFSEHILVYKLLKEDVPPNRTKYSIVIRPVMANVGVNICGALNRSVIPDECDNGSLVLESSASHVTFSIYNGQELLKTGSFDGEYS